MHNIVSLHHYATKSTAEFGAKVARGSAMGNHKGTGFVRRIDAKAVRVCEGAAALAAALRAAGVLAPAPDSK